MGWLERDYYSMITYETINYLGSLPSHYYIQAEGSEGGDGETLFIHILFFGRGSGVRMHGIEQHGLESVSLESRFYEYFSLERRI